MGMIFAEIFIAGPPRQQGGESGAWKEDDCNRQTSRTTMDLGTGMTSGLTL